MDSILTLMEDEHTCMVLTLNTTSNVIEAFMLGTQDPAILDGNMVNLPALPDGHVPSKIAAYNWFKDDSPGSLSVSTTLNRVYGIQFNPDLDSVAALDTADWVLLAGI